MNDWYATHARYPDSLEALSALPPDRQPPLTDRWRRPWDYSLTRFRHLPGVEAQRYALTSRKLGRASVLADALRTPATAAPEVRLVRIVALEPVPAAELDFRLAGSRRVTLSEGAEHAGVQLVKVGERSLLLCDGDRWQLVRRRIAGRGTP